MAGTIRVAILTVSDRSFRGLRPDLSGPALEAAACAYGWEVTEMRVLPDEAEQLAAYLAAAAASGKFDLVLTTGGTGFAPRDVTPEATTAVIERPAPGLMEAIRAESLKNTPHGMLSRGVAGIARRALVVNLSGSPKAAVEQLAVIAPTIPHAVELLQESSSAEAGHRAPGN